jgi:hypothetical protein
VDVDPLTLDEGGDEKVLLNKPVGQVHQAKFGALGLGQGLELVQGCVLAEVTLVHHHIRRAEPLNQPRVKRGVGAVAPDLAPADTRSAVVGT